MKKTFDVIVIGGGPGGSTAASFLAKNKVDVAIFERETYPRFHIGESLLPATMPIYKETGFYETLSGGKYIEKNGARFIDYRNDDEVYFGFSGGINPAIPMAYEVPRADFDKDILEHAVKCGAKLFQPERVTEVMPGKDSVVVKTNKGEYEAKYLLDTSGRDAYLGKRMKLRQVNPDLNNVGVFAHYVGVNRYPGRNEGDITVGLLPGAAWTWIIPFKGDRTSVGMVCTSSAFKAESDLGEYLSRNISVSPRCRKMMENAERVSEVTVISNYSHTSEVFSGDRWILAGDAAIFLDPIFSSGVHVASFSGKQAALTLIKAMNRRVTLQEDGLGDAYQKLIMKGVDRFHSLVSLFYQGAFVEQMKKTLTLKNTMEAFTSAVAGDVWNEDNFLFQKKVL